MPLSVVYAAVLALVLLLFGLLLGRGFMDSLQAVAQNYATGYGVLAAVNWLGPYLGVNLPINAVTLLAGGCLGAPGVALAAALQFVA